jgi:hypothetical protein
VAKWRAQGIVPPGSAARIIRMYQPRLTELAGGPRPAKSPVVTKVPSGETVPEAATDHAAVPPPSHPPAGPSVGELLEAHWLKLLAVLAAAFIVAGVRQVLGVEWVERLVRALIPCVPIGLSAVLLRYGTRNAPPRSIAARTCGGVGIILTAFAVTSVNKHWLSLSIPLPWAHFLAITMCAAAAFLVLRATDDRIYEHYVFGALVLAAPLLVTALAETTLSEPAKPWQLAAILAVVGTGLMTFAARTSRSSGILGQVRREASYFWASASLGGAVAFALMEGLAQQSESIGPIAVLVGCAITWGIAALMLDSRELAVGSVGSLTLAGIFALQRIPDTGIIEWGYLGAILGSVWALTAVADWAGKEAQPSDVTKAFLTASGVAFGLSGLQLVGRCLQALDGMSLSGPDWSRVVALALVCAVAYAAFAVRTRQPAVLFASALSAGIAVFAASERLLPMADAYPHHAGHDMAVACIALLICGVAVDFGSKPLGSTVWPATWSAAWVYAGSLAGAVALAITLVRDAPDVGTTGWITLAAVTLTCGASAILMRRSPERPAPLIAGGVSQAGAAALVALLGHRLYGDLGASAGLLVSAWAFAAIASLTGSRDSQMWPAPFLIVAFGALLVAVIVLANAAATVRHEGVALLAIASVAYVLSAAFREEADRPSNVLSAAALAVGWAMQTDASAGGSNATGWMAIASLLCAFGFGRSAARGFREAGWLSGISAVAAWYGIICWSGLVPSVWTALAMLPGLMLLFVFGESTGCEPHLRSVLRRCAVVALLASAAAHEVAQIQSQAPDHLALAVTFAGQAAAMLWGVLSRRNQHWTLAASVLASAAAAHACASAGFAGALWALWFTLAGGLYIVGVYASHKSSDWEAVAHTLTATATVHSVVGYLAALATVAERDMGTYGVLAIVLSGALFASLFATRRAAAFAHAAMGCFFTAYAIYLYDSTNIGFGVLDLYLIPVGAYFLALGHLSDRYRRPEEAHLLWWTGLTTVLAPTFIAFWIHFTEGGTGLHAFLLVGECAAAIAWGIVERIRAFVIVGVTFALAFAAVLLSATVRQFSVGLLALMVGLALLAFVYQLSMHSSEARSLLDRMARQWRTWR